MPKPKTEQTNKIIELVKLGFSNIEICRKLNCKESAVTGVKQRENLPRKKHNTFDWEKVQEYYNLGYSYRDCAKYFNVSQTAIWKAMKKGKLVTRTSQEGVKLSILQGKNSTRVVSEETKSKMSKKICQKVKEGTWHYSFSKVRSYEFISKFAGVVKLMGSWELAYANYLDNNNIKWERPKEKFYYEFEGLKSGQGYYIPDFFLTDSQTYIEIKGYETSKDRAKWAWFPKQLNHIVLKKVELTALGLQLSGPNSKKTVV